MFIFFIISILAGLFYCIIPILLLFEFYHWLTRQSEVRYPLLKGVSYGLIIGLAVAFLLSSGGSGESGMIGGGMAIIILPTSIVLGFIIGYFYKIFDRTIFLRKKVHF
jgi:hypothetical protein